MNDVGAYELQYEAEKNNLRAYDLQVLYHGGKVATVFRLKMRVSVSEVDNETYYPEYADLDYEIKKGECWLLLGCYRYFGMIKTPSTIIKRIASGKLELFETFNHL